jgi:hypothetical protein
MVQTLIPRKTFKLELKPAEPTVLTPELMQKQLRRIGLTCEYTKPEMLAQFIAEVEATIPEGVVETYSILKPAKPGEERIEGMQGDWTQSSTGNWEPDSTGLGYAADLEYIVYPEHFDWLKGNRPQFVGSEDKENFSRRYDTVAAVKQAFVDLALTASSALVKGLNKPSIESVFSNVISPLDDAGARNYDKSDSRVVFLVESYDPSKKEADAVGALLVDWHLVIKDYKDKKELKHDATLDVTARAVLYGDINDMKADLDAAKAHFKGRSFGGQGYNDIDAIPVQDTTVEIYDRRPPADSTTFRRSLPLVATSKTATVLVMYAPDLQNIGSLDNSNSAATSTFEKSVSTGFTFSMTQQIEIGAEFEAGIVLAKGKVSVGFSLSFTEEWSTETTETISFEVPPGEKAFTYQGTLRSQKLEYDPATDLYTYREAARFLSPVTVTSKVPIDSGTKPEIIARGTASL